ncbi:hypothetical protein [Pedobacter miscanthi]|uniref:Lipoprotein n=1 Tax=Pedobacter miscanthi TaxID=2259170 RepID=A0A366KW08_9SPHI|nr:hypothetical protein [Pedobacter miscanthi]RBQ05845.1 hypothetical protein DRW42_15210 [Pedobacter miscanthi]
MKSTLTVMICLLFTSCNFFKKSPEDRYREKMENATDEELMNEIIGKPLMYEVVNYDYISQRKRKLDGKIMWSSSQLNNYTIYRNAQTGGLLPTSKEEGDKLGYEKLGVSSGAVVQVIFTKGSIYIEKFGRLNGSYEQGKYANADGTIKLEFYKYIEAGFGNLKTRTMRDIDFIRDNPVRNCALMGIKYYRFDQISNKKVVVHYYLKTLTDPGYFHKDSNEK